MVNAIYLVTDRDSFAAFGEMSQFAFVRDIWASPVAPNTGLFIGLLIAGAVTMGILVLSGGRRMQFGLVLLMGFHVGLLFFGWWLWLYAVPMLGALLWLLRAERHHMVDHQPAQTRSALGDEPGRGVARSAKILPGTPEERGAAQRAYAFRGLGIVVALAAFSATFVALDQAYFHFVSGHFPAVGRSTSLATLYGLVSRLHLILPLLVLALWQPRLLGFQIGQTHRHWRILLLFLVANCGIVGGYLLLSGNTTPYSGNEWLLTEVVIVPLVEETMWRGVVFAILLSAYRRIQPDSTATTSAVWSCGLAFGLLHAANALAGIPVVFVAVQVLNAAVWGVVYSYARALTGSVYPPIVLHAAMNLVVVLL